jgi:hypothetical protein
MGMNLWGESRLYENLKMFMVIMDTNIRTPDIVLVYHATISYIDLPPVLKKYFVYGIN